MEYFDVFRTAQKHGPLSMKSMLRTKKYIGVISLGRLILYRERPSPSNEIEFRQLIQLQCQNATVEVKSHHKHENRFTLIIHTTASRSTKNETFEVNTIYNTFVVK